MSGTGRILLAVAAGAVLGLSGGLMTSATAAAAYEWNPVRTHAVALGAEASRLVVGFRATSGNTVIKTIKTRARTQSIKIVQAKTAAGDVAALVQRTHVGMAGSRQLTPSMHVVYLQKTLYGADVKTALDNLRADPAVEFAEVDQRRYAMSVPNDPLFAAPADVATTDSSGRSGQWYMQTPNSATVIAGTATEDLSATDAVSAWTITTGSSGTVIADVDSGIRFDHPDLLRAGFGGRLLPGYDFVGEDFNRSSGAALGTFLIANDGDGWDPDPSDPGDWINSTDQQNTLFPAADCPVEDTSWHGTRVMGVLGAITNNDTGIAGMTWNPYILPVRALGKCGGFDSDIIAGMEWAAGMTVNNPDGSAVPDNPYPADIINLSLGGSGACPSDYQSALDTLNAMGVLVVASAGNQSGAVAAPGNCSGVLAVAGLRNVGTKVGYSSFGAQVGVAAPAGNCVNSSGACLRSIDTTYNTGLTVPATNGYTDETSVNLGTSFSAPIVSGIAALMRAVNANLTPAQLIARIESSATAFPPNTGNLPVCPNVDATSGECSCVPGQCGAGMVNALSAVTAALNPISAITADAGNTFDAGASVAACNQTIASYKWTTTGGVAIAGSATAAKVTVTITGAGTLALAVTDAAGHTDNSASVSFSAAGAATVNAPSSVGTAATACVTPMTVTPAPPTVTEAFSPASVSTNTASTLTITFNNTNGFALTQSSFTETLPANLSVETSPAPTTDCPGGSGTLTSSASSVTLAGANIPASGNCTITLSVKSATAGTYTSTVAANALTTAPAGNNPASASASLTVSAPAPSKSGGGAIDWYDLVFAAGVLIASRLRFRRRELG